MIKDWSSDCPCDEDDDCDKNVVLGGEEQSESLLEEVHRSSADLVLQRRQQTAEGSTNQNAASVPTTTQILNQVKLNLLFL